MKQFEALWGREPAMVVAFIQALIAMGLAFGLNLSDEQFAAIITVTSLGVGLLTRSQVTPVVKIDP
jgi:pyrroline-5-carboxylate reductase